MLPVVGYVIVFASVFGGFALAGGHLAAMLQPVELLIIAGAAFGAFIVGNPMKVVKSTRCRRCSSRRAIRSACTWT
jgi:chemotaxis protein MotA